MQEEYGSDAALSSDTLMVGPADWSLEEPLTLAESGALPPP